MVVLLKKCIFELNQTVILHSFLAKFTMKKDHRLDFETLGTVSKKIMRHMSARVKVWTISMYFLTIANNFLALSCSISVYLRLFWTIFVFLGASQCISVCLRLSATICNFLELSWTISYYLGLFWTIWDYLGISQTIWNYLGLSLTIWDYLGI